MKNILFLLSLYSSLLHAQQGVGTPVPQETFHVNGTMQITNSMKVGGNAYTKGSPGLPDQILKSNGPNEAASWEPVAGEVPKATGTVIVVDGEYIVAQEITVQMSADFSGKAGDYTFTEPICNLTDEIVDNENAYIGTNATNSFKVSANGIYQINMNVQLATNFGGSPVVGIWNNTKGKWIARVNDYFAAPTNKLQTYTLITAIPMSASDTFSFRVANLSDYIVKKSSEDKTGSGSITQISLKRLR
ncbi:hypothetical protein [Flavobacterium hercynium]|uniref:C1q domain-containing protein n=1 Tax=Flavobacterium hercynium TaxID=387094 RepID=A0A226HHJ3_9FLAO|nr:hypothetical protein [Flavobacterium hercynium]OXA93146.1 hypothetical protein B0A66_07680 [Flavobacterium hercynium]SMP32760.1 hypothetical protein SAMN06265346_11583 [Flavobacterium hercynium]